MSIMRDEIVHIAEADQCTGSCFTCCPGTERFWYQYIDEALGCIDDQTSVAEIRNKAVDDGAPFTIIGMLDGLLRTLRVCGCRTEICWCDTETQDMGAWSKVRPYSQKDIDYTNAFLKAMAGEMASSLDVPMPDYKLSFTERPGVGNVCWCGQSVSAADTEALDAHSYCSPEQ